MKDIYYAKIPDGNPYDENINYFKKFEENTIKQYEESKEIDDLEKFEAIKNIRFVCKNFYIRTEKSKYKEKILKWFYNIYEYGCFSIHNEVINSMQESLRLDAFPIYIKFLNNKLIRIDNESDLTFYKFIDREFGGIMY